MNKALILVILALFGLNAMSSQMFRPITSRPGNPPPFNPTTSRPVLYDDVEDNNLALDLRLPKDPNSYRIRFDEAQDDEMFRMEIPTGSTPPFNPTHIRPTRLDDFEDDNLASWSTGGSRVGGLSSTGPYINRPTGGRVFDDAEDNEMYRMENPTGSTPPFNPTHIRPTRFDDFEDDNLASWNAGGSKVGSTGPYINRPSGGRVFDDAQDDEMFTQGDMGRMGGFLGSGNSGLIGGGGSVRGGGVAWGGAGQYAHNIGKNTQLIGGASVSHYPGSTVSISPHVGIKHSF